MAATERLASQNGQPRVFLVDDHPVVREGIAATLRRTGSLEVCGEAGSPMQALEAVSALNPDIVVVDLVFAGGSGLGLVRDLKVRHPNLRVLVLSMHDESLYAERVLRAGACGYIMKHEITDHIVEAIHQVLRGGIYLSERMAARMLQKLAGKEPSKMPTALESLSDRELEVFQLLAQGLSTREVGEKLFLSIKTIETHLEHVKLKLGLDSGRELFRYAIVWSLEGRTSGTS